MFDDIGSKIKSIAKVMCWVGIVISAVPAFVLFSNAPSQSTGAVSVVLGFVVLIVGSLASWVGSVFMYGFGELIEKATLIEHELAKNRVQNIEAPIKPVDTAATAGFYYGDDSEDDD